LESTSRNPAVIASTLTAAIWCALSVLVLVASVSALVREPNAGNPRLQPETPAVSISLAGYGCLNAFVAFRVARLKRWAFIALPVVVLPWLIYAGTFLLMAEFARNLVTSLAALTIVCVLIALGAYPFLRAEGLLQSGV
jgi:hypothetical protein